MMTGRRSARRPTAGAAGVTMDLRSACCSRRRRTAVGRIFAVVSAAALPLFYSCLIPAGVSADCPIPASAHIVGQDDRNDNDNVDADDDDGPTRTLFVHIVPHTHDDVGWLKTVDQYYYGFNSTIQRAAVKYILDTVVVALQQNPDRKFTYVEMAFFSKWYYEQTEETRNVVRGLVTNGQLSFANGGWCMHDEAAAHYIGMIDQTTLGHSFLASEFNGYVPKVGWQLDPFGHSSTQASLMTSKMGFDALYFGRIDYQDLKKRHDEGRCEGIWSASPDNFRDDANVFWGLTGSYGGNYGPPSGFCFDAGCNDEYLVGNEEEHLKERIVEFLADVAVQAGRTRGRHVMLTVGSDFQYSNAFINFENYDYLIDAVRRYQSSGEIDVPSMFQPRFDQVRIFYSNPDVYTQCKHDDYLRMNAATAAADDYLRMNPATAFDSADDDRSALKSSSQSPVASSLPPQEGAVDEDDGGIKSDQVGNSGDLPAAPHSAASVASNSNVVEQLVWDTKTDDFFPYSDCDHCFWTGYFTSRPSLKRLERTASSFLHAARQIESYREALLVIEHDREDEASSNAAERGLGRRDDSPLRRLEEAVGVAQHHDAVSGTSKQHVAFDYAMRLAGGMNDAVDFSVQGLRLALLGDDNGDGDALLQDLTYCHELNATVCRVSQDATKTPGTDLYAVIYNALGVRDEFISIPITMKADYTVERLTATTTSSAGSSSSASSPPADAGVREQQWEEVPSVRIPTANNSGTVDAAPYVLHFDAGTLPPAGAAVYRIRMATAAASDEDKDEDEATTAAAREETPAVAATAGGEGAGYSTRTRHSDTTAGDDEDAVAGAAAASMVSRRSLLRATAGDAAGSSTAGSDLDRIISNGNFEVHFKRGLMTGVTSATGDGDDDTNFDHAHVTWGYYTSFDEEHSQRSGAYIFRPKTPTQKLHVLEPDPLKSWIFESDLVTEVHLAFKEPWMKQITRIKKGQPYVEVEYTVGPIPIDDAAGKEIVARYTATGIDNGGTFYTDSNGREFQERRRSHRPTWDLEEFEPVAGNYYPVNAAAYIEDDSSSMAVLVDRSQGGASLADGSLELMVQRRILADDGRGVGEPLNETVGGVSPYPPYGDARRMGEGVIITGTHRIMLGRGNSGASLARSMMDRTWSPPHVFVASSSSSNNVLFKQPGFSGIGCEIPPNVMIITHSLVESMGPVSTFLVRFAHQYANGEDAKLSKPVDVDLKKCYDGYVRISIEETTLSGNQNIGDWEKSRLRWDKSGEEVGTRNVVNDGWVVQLSPMEIKTFLVRLST